MPSSAQWMSSKARTIGRSAAIASIIQRTTEKKASRVRWGSADSDGDSASGASIPSRRASSAAWRRPVSLVTRPPVSTSSSSSRSVSLRHATSEGSASTIAALGPHDLAQRPEHDARPVRQAAALAQVGHRVTRAQAHFELAQQARLAHAGGADQRDQVRAALALDPAIDRLEQRDLVGPADERRLAPDLQPRRGHGEGAGGHERGDGLGLALEVQRLERVVGDRRRGGAARAVAHGDAARLPGRLQACGDVDGVADDRVALPDRARQHLAGVDADPQLEGDVVEVALELGVDLAHRLLHAEGGANGALGVVLVRHRRPEDRHDVVADVLVDLAAEALDLLAQAPQAAVDERLDRLGIHALGDRGVAGEVGEQDGDLAALLGGRCLGARVPAPAPAGWPRACNGVPQWGQKRASAGTALAAGRAALLQPRAAVHAEARALGSSRPTALAHHASHPKDGTGCSSAAWRKSCRRARRARSWPRGRAWPAGSNRPRSARSSAPSPTSPGP